MRCGTRGGRCSARPGGPRPPGAVGRGTCPGRQNAGSADALLAQAARARGSSGTKRPPRPGACRHGGTSPAHPGGARRRPARPHRRPPPPRAPAGPEPESLCPRRRRARPGACAGRRERPSYRSRPARGLLPAAPGRRGPGRCPLGRPAAIPGRTPRRRAGCWRSRGRTAQARRSRPTTPPPPPAGRFRQALPARAGPLRSGPGKPRPPSCALATAPPDRLEHRR